MANHPSAAKRNRQRLKRTLRNRQISSALRTAVKKARVAIQNGAEDAAQLARAAERALARAASKGVIHANTASRTTARIASQLAKSVDAKG
jgi:small subunit ribosomal protein S20